MKRRTESHFFTSWIKASFSRKFMTALLASMSVIILFSCCAYYFSTVRIIRSEYIASNRQLLKEVNQGIERYYTQLDNTTRSLYTDSTFIDNLTAQRNDYASVIYNESVIKNLMYEDDSIQYIYFYTPFDQRLYSFSRLNISHTCYPEFEEEEWYRQTLQAKHFFTLLPLHDFVNHTHSGSVDEERVFSANRAMRYYVTGKIIGMISINYSTSYLDSICQNVYTDNSYTAVLDNDLNFVLNNYEEYSLTEEIRNALLEEADASTLQYSSNGIRRLLIWDKSEHFYLLKDIPMNELTENTRSILRIVLVFSAAIFIFAVITAFCLSRTATHRLKQLTLRITEFAGNGLTIGAEDYGVDEIGILARAFQDMTGRINELINLEYKAKILKTNAELQALQAQINPHFINNVLQSLGTLGLKSGAPEVYTMANALARILRYSLKPTTQLVPLQQEIDHMNDYLFIEKILRGDRLNVITDISPGVEEYLVPVFILQPLIENSVKHGLDDCAAGLVTVSISQKDSSLSITIADHGRGIPEASLEMLRKWLGEDTIRFDFENHIGIRNIVGRIRLIYEDSASFLITCPREGGTRIHITLPKKQKEIT